MWLEAVLLRTRTASKEGNDKIGCRLERAPSLLHGAELERSRNLVGLGDQLGGEGSEFILEKTMRAGRMENRGWSLNDSEGQMFRTRVAACGREQGRDSLPSWVDNVKRGVYPV